MIKGWIRSYSSHDTSYGNLCMTMGSRLLHNPAQMPRPASGRKYAKMLQFTSLILRRYTCPSLFLLCGILWNLGAIKLWLLLDYLPNVTIGSGPTRLQQGVVQSWACWGNIVENRNSFLAKTSKPKESCLKKPNFDRNQIFIKTEYSAEMYLFGRKSVIRPKETFFAIIIFFRNLFSKKSKNRGSYQVYFCQNSLFWPKSIFLPNTETDKSWNRNRNLFRPKLKRNVHRLSTTQK